MKNLLILILIFYSFQVIGKDFEPITKIIDDSEKSITMRHGEDWYNRYGIEFMVDFYNAYENGTLNPRFNEIMAKVTGFRDKLKYDNVCFIENGWLYVLSYEPNTDLNEHVGVYLYCKNVKIMGNAWERLGSPIFRDSKKVINGFYFTPQFASDNSNGMGNTIELPIYKNVFIALCGMSIRMVGSSVKYYNQLIIFTQERINDNGLPYYSTNMHLNYEHYPKSFTGIINEGKIVNTIDNKGLKQDIKIMMGGFHDGDKLSEDRVSFDGDYGWSLSYE